MSYREAQRMVITNLFCMFDVRENMKKQMQFILVLIIILANSAPRVTAQNQIEIEYFFHRDCGSCEPSKKALEGLVGEYAPYLRVEWRDMYNKESFVRFFEYNLSRRPSIVFNSDPSTALYNMSERSLRIHIEHYIYETDGNGTIPNPNGNEGLREITLPLVVFSGLIDGINPCAFSLLIFFLSFLYGLRRSRRNVFFMGMTYIAGVFIGYVSIGLGVLRTISLLGITHPFGMFGVVLLIIMGVLQIFEASNVSAPRIKIPGFAIQRFMELAEKATVPIAIVMGLVVSLFEFPCSGGTYIGILAILAHGSVYNGLTFLAIYNLMFVAPLLVVLLLANNAKMLLKMDEWSVSSRQRLKFASGITLIIVAVLTWMLVY